MRRLGSRLGSKHGRRRTPSVQGIILCPLLEEILVGLDHLKHQCTPALGGAVFGFALRGRKASGQSTKRRSQELEYTSRACGLWRRHGGWPHARPRAARPREAYAASSVCMYTLLAARPLRFAAGSRRSATPRMTALLRWVA